MMKQTDAVIVGAGPIGIEMAVALKKKGISYVHYEAGCLGWTINWYAPSTTFFSSAERLAIAGVPLLVAGQRKPTREEYIEYLRGVAQQFDLSIETYRAVTAVCRSADGCWEVHSQRSHSGVGGPIPPTLESGTDLRIVRAKYVILAIGDMHHPNQIDTPGEDLPHVSHYLQDPHLYFGKRVVICGGRNSAAEAAIRLYHVGATVSIVHRGAVLSAERLKYWIYPELAGLIRHGQISFYGSSVISAITPSTVSIVTGDRMQDLPADFVLLLVGYRQDSSLYRSIGLTLEGPGSKPFYDPDTMETSLRNIFVAGTGAAGTQLGSHKEFIETSHIHVERIIAKITGSPPPSSIQLQTSDAPEM